MAPTDVSFFYYAMPAHQNPSAPDTVGLLLRRPHGEPEGGHLVEFSKGGVTLQGSMDMAIDDKARGYFKEADRKKILDMFQAMEGPFTDCMNSYRLRCVDKVQEEGLFYVYEHDS